jgi:ATP-dependent DNA ligase
MVLRISGPNHPPSACWRRASLAIAEITYMTWSDDGLLRHTVFVGLREDKPAIQALD